tara:strand:+ start:286 stop:831 length:546 start_codon:yes stop_codon:yes gene_type:complete
VKKLELRKQFLNLRKKNYRANLSISPNRFVRFLKKKNIKSKKVGGYFPYNNEMSVLNILEFLEKKKYHISLPVIGKKNSMNFIRWSHIEPLKINKYGIPEPLSLNKIKPDILLIPLVAFDNRLNRLGYGGGFYDRYLSKLQKNSKIIKIGIGFSFQKVKHLPINKHDQKLDYIITEKNFFE